MNVTTVKNLTAKEKQAMSSVTDDTPGGSSSSRSEYGARGLAKKIKTATNAKAAKRAAGPERTNKKAEVIALMKRAGGATLQRHHARHQMAASHGPRVHQHPGEQGRPEGRVPEERGWGAHVPNRRVPAGPAPTPLRGLG
jgi:hypothetical protein